MACAQRGSADWASRFWPETSKPGPEISKPSIILVGALLKIGLGFEDLDPKPQSPAPKELGSEVLVRNLEAQPRNFEA